MKSRIKRTVPVALLIAVLLTVVQAVLGMEEKLDNVQGLLYTDRGVLLAADHGDSTVLSLLDWEGVVRASARVPRRQKQELYTLEDLAMDDAGIVYLIKTSADRLTGKPGGQYLEVWDITKTVGARLASVPLPEEGVTYRWVEVSSGIINLMGTTAGEESILRTTHDVAAARGGTLTANASRSYPATEGEGVWEAAINGSNIAYIARTGRIYTADSDAAWEVYPAQELYELMYAVFLSPQGESILLGEQESGNLLALNLTDLSTSLIKSGTEPFSGVSDYAPADILTACVQSPHNYAAVVKNRQTGYFELVVARDGSFLVAPGLRGSFLSGLLKSGVVLLVTFTGAFALLLGVWQILALIRSGRTILVKLTASALPLLVLSLVVFGIFSYRSYEQSVIQSFQKQVEDEGNVLAALFGTQSFSEIEYPYDYTGEAYRYLSDMMATRDVICRTAFYERSSLYTGVGESQPCAYPFGVRLNRESERLHMAAVNSGQAAVGVVEEGGGRRLVCVTPIGGGSTSTVYLLETAINYANVEGFTSDFIRNYLLIAAACILVVSLLLIACFVGILAPLAELKRGLEDFSTGNRRVQLTNASGDELADIGRVFNKMAKEIDLQLYNLNSISEAYARYVPISLFRLLGQDNLGSLTLGSFMEGELCVLCADMVLRDERMEAGRAVQVTNQLFHTLNVLARKYQVTLVPDGAGLRSFKIVCAEQADSAVAIAASALAQVDSINAGLSLSERIDLVFYLDKCRVCYVLCGDEERLIPALIVPELEGTGLYRELPRRMGSRLLATSYAFAGLQNATGVFHRYLGNPDGEGGEESGFYDFYDSTTPEMTTRINKTKPTFDKGVTMYGQQRYAEAKNLFAVVLRENQADNVARHYLFRCENKLRTAKKRSLEPEPVS